MPHELWSLENSTKGSVSDEFLDAINMQTNYLENEIAGWLKSENDNLKQNIV
jgi:hypothetical protein